MSSSAPSAPSKLRSLFTKEDKGNIHKMFGLFALLHFIYRFANVGSSDMAFKADGRTIACLGAHAMLSATSLIFRIPIKRIAEGSRIWPEYRLHSIAFAYRSIACLLVTWYELKHGVSTPFYLANAAIVICTMLAADFGTWWVGPAGRSSTIQGLDAPPPMRFFFSVMQFHATAGCLVGVRRFSTQFFYVWIIRECPSPMFHILLHRFPPASRALANARLTYSRPPRYTCCRSLPLLPCRRVHRVSDDPAPQEHRATRSPCGYIRSDAYRRLLCLDI